MGIAYITHIMYIFIKIGNNKITDIGIKQLLPIKLPTIKTLNLSKPLINSRNESYRQ